MGLAYGLATFRRSKMPSETTKRWLSNGLLVVAILIATGLLGLAVAKGVTGSHVGEEAVAPAVEASEPPAAAAPVVAANNVPQAGAVARVPATQARGGQTRQPAQNTMGRQQVPNQNQGMQQRTPTGQQQNYGMQNRGQTGQYSTAQQQGRGRGQQVPANGQRGGGIVNGGNVPADAEAVDPIDMGGDGG